jgi:hypothetical protein
MLLDFVLESLGQVRIKIWQQLYLNKTLERQHYLISKLCFNGMHIRYQGFKSSVRFSAGCLVPHGNDQNQHEIVVITMHAIKAWL